MKPAKLFLSLTVAAVLGAAAGLTAAYAGEPPPVDPNAGAMEQLQQAAQDGQEAVAAPTEEEAKVESNETFDTPHDSDGN